MSDQTVNEAQLEHLLVTAKAEYQTLKNEEKDVVIRGKSLARIYRQLIDVIGQLNTERSFRQVLESAIERDIRGNKQLVGISFEAIAEALSNGPQDYQDG